MSSRIRINRLPLQNAARAIRAVSSGTGSIADGRIDIASLLQGVPRLNTPISPNDQQYQDCLIWQKRRCSILFHFEVPGGKWHTEILSPVWSAKSAQPQQSCHQGPFGTGPAKAVFVVTVPLRRTGPTAAAFRTTRSRL